MNSPYRHCDADPGRDFSHSRQPKRIAIVTPFFGVPTGIATACRSLADSLKRDGHDVTIVLGSRNPNAAPWFEYWKDICSRDGIKLLKLPTTGVPVETGPDVELAYSVYEFLRNEDFELIHFPELFGLGYYCLLAKKLGLAFRDTLLCVTVNGPFLWHMVGSQHVPRKAYRLVTYDYLERKSAELADVVFAPSQYALQWVSARGWRLPKRAFVEQYLLPRSAVSEEPAPLKGFDELVFFGMLNLRKGLELFCDGLDRLSPEAWKHLRRITFIGPSEPVRGESSRKYLARKLRKLPCAWRTLPGVNPEQALAYARSRKALVVLPSLRETLGFTMMECIAGGVPFLGSRIPGYEELLDPRQHQALLFEATPDALARKLEEALKNGLKSRARFRVKPSVTENRWRRWHQARERPVRSLKARSHPAPRISVCIAHRNRPAYLQQALDSLKRQTMPPYEVIVVDDASDSPPARAFLRELPRLSRPLRCRVRVQRARSGPSACRNEAAKRARGDYLLFMDDDNLAKPREIEILAQTALASGADILTCAFDRFKGEKPPIEGKPPLSRFVPLGDSLSCGFFSNTFGDMNALIRRSAFQRLGGLRSPDGLETGWQEDGEFFARAVLQGYQLVTIPEALFWYREHEKGLRRSVDPFHGDLFRMTAYRELARHPDLQALLDSGLLIWNTVRSLRPKPPAGNVIERYGLPIYSALSSRELSGLRASAGLQTAWKKGALELRLDCREAFLRVPLGRRKSLSGRLLVELEITAEQPNFLDVACPGKSLKGSKRVFTAGAPVSAGRSICRASLYGEKFIGPIRLSFLRPAQVLRIHGVELLWEEPQ